MTAAPAAARSIYVDSAFHVLKGAVVKLLRIKTGRTSLSVQNQIKESVHSGTITIGPIAKFEKGYEAKLQDLVNEKIAENLPFHLFEMDRKKAEELYYTVLLSIIHLGLEEGHA